MRPAPNDAGCWRLRETMPLLIPTAGEPRERRERTLIGRFGLRLDRRIGTARKERQGERELLRYGFADVDHGAGERLERDILGANRGLLLFCLGRAVEQREFV